MAKIKASIEKVKKTTNRLVNYFNELNENDLKAIKNSNVKNQINYLKNYLEVDNEK